MTQVAMTRRELVLGGLASGFAGSLAWLAPEAAGASRRPQRPIEIIAAPSNLGLRPSRPEHEPGAWRAPAAFLGAGLSARLQATRVVTLARPPYEFDRQSGTRIRNGITLREHALALADAVAAALAGERFPLVLGGDCSILLGCLAGARRRGRCGLLHVDGHSDFFHPGNYDAASVLGAAAGMDLALATGRGEPLLTQWPQVGTLVGDEDVIQIGEREAPPAGTGGDAFFVPSIVRFTMQEIQRLGMAEIFGRVLARLEQRKLMRVWLHVDLDVLDKAVMPAVDSPGSPGFDFSGLALLMAKCVASGRVVGLDVAIYDPELDPAGKYLPPIVDCLASGLAPLGPSPPTAREQHR